MWVKYNKRGRETCKFSAIGWRNTNTTNTVSVQPHWISSSCGTMINWPGRTRRNQLGHTYTYKQGRWHNTTWQIDKETMKNMERARGRERKAGGGGGGGGKRSLPRFDRSIVRRIDPCFFSPSYSPGKHDRMLRAFESPAKMPRHSAETRIEEICYEE